MSKNNHNHCHCDHDLKHCSKCDVVYCDKCGEEWKKNPYYFTTTGTSYLNYCSKSSKDSNHC